MRPQYGDDPGLLPVATAEADESADDGVMPFKSGRTHEPCVPTASIHRPAPNGGQRHRTASIRSPSKETPSIRTAKSIPSPRNGEQRHCTDGIRSPDLKLRPASWTKRAATASPAGIHRCRWRYWKRERGIIEPWTPATGRDAKTRVADARAVRPYL